MSETSNSKNAAVFIVKFLLFITVFILFYFLFAYFSYTRLYDVFVPLFENYNFFENNAAVSIESDKPPIIILDAGHGGIDGGAVSASGIKEKDVNLNIATKIGEFLSIEGVKVVYTRSGDHLLADTSLKRFKQTDLLNRVKLASSYDDGIFVSIHQNSFAVAKYKGAQVFFSPNNPKSEAFAIVLQTDIIKTLQPENNRVAKKADSNIFVLDRLSNVAVMIECGFLSNVEEAELLNTDEYQNKFAYVVSQAIIRYLNL